MFTHLHGPSYPTHVCKVMTHTKSHPLTHLRPCRRNACSLLLNVTVLCSHSDMHLCIGKTDQRQTWTEYWMPRQCWMCSTLSSSPLRDTPSLQALCFQCMKALVALRWRKQHGMNSAWRTSWGDTTVCTTEYHRHQVELTNIQCNWLMCFTHIGWSWSISDNTVGLHCTHHAQCTVWCVDNAHTLWCYTVLHALLTLLVLTGNAIY